MFGKKKKQVNELQQIHEDRKYLLTSNSDFYIREAYKTMRTNVTFSLADKDGSKVVIVTSSLQSEGKSTTAINLAISFAQTDKKVVIVDCDMRRPKLARLFEVKNHVGLSDLCVDPSKLDEAIMHTEVEGMDMVLAGSIPPNPSELLGSVRMGKIVDELRSRYDLVVLDTPPVNMVTDAAVLSPKSDGIIFVVRANQSERGDVTHAVEQLEYAKAKVLGFVLNGVDMENTSYGYKRYKRYGYGGYGGYGDTPEA